MRNVKDFSNDENGSGRNYEMSADFWEARIVFN